jgi:hypothetical protein
MYCTIFPCETKCNTNELLYTGITRAEEKLVIMSTHEYLDNMVDCRAEKPNTKLSVILDYYHNRSRKTHCVLSLQYCINMIVSSS